MGVFDNAMQKAMGSMLPAGLDAGQVMQSIAGIAQMAQEFSMRMARIESKQDFLFRQNEEILRLLRETREK